MSTSPDDHVSVSPPLMTTFVVPSVLGRQVHDFLRSLGLTVGKHPATPDEGTFLAVPSPELVQALSDVSGRYFVDYEDSAFALPFVHDRELAAHLATPPTYTLDSTGRVCAHCQHSGNGHGHAGDGTVLCGACECRTVLPAGVAFAKPAPRRWVLSSPNASAAPQWVPRALTNPDCLPTSMDAVMREGEWTCQQCLHPAGSHHQWRYRAPLSAYVDRDVTVIMCPDPDCACRSRAVDPTPK